MSARMIQWDLDVWEDHLYWQVKDKKILKRINQPVKEISRNPFEGIGKPEPLKANLLGLWSRRIDEEHRLVYSVEDDRVLIFLCRGHCDQERGWECVLFLYVGSYGERVLSLVETGGISWRNNKNYWTKQGYLAII